jgi:hypothetical protein
MYVGVIRGDMPGPIWIGDLEPVSQTNFPVEPVGQTAYISYPNATALTNYLGGLDPDGDPAKFQGSGGVPAGMIGSAAVTFPLTLSGANNTLSLQSSSTGSFHSYVIATGTYANMTSLLAAVNTALTAGGSGANATKDTATGTFFVLQSNALGVGSYIGVNASGTSTFNTPSNLTASTHFQMPTAASIITAMLPVGGPLNVSSAAILTNLGASPAAAGAVNLIAPQFTETTVAVQSFQIGVMSKFLESTYNPDPRLLPALAYGPAITVVQNNGSSLFTAPLPIITGAVHNSPNTGDITISGQDLGNSESFTATEVRITGVAGLGKAAPVIRLGQHVIVNTLTGGTQGVVSPTSIVIPASLLTYSPPGKPFPPVPVTAGTALGVAGSTVEVQYTSLANGNYGSAATLSSFKNPYVTVTGLTRMTAACVGGQLSITGPSSVDQSFNYGTFLITQYISATSVVILNPLAVVPDPNNGSLVWAQVGPVPFTVT